jgi:putative membrane protein
MITLPIFIWTIGEEAIVWGINITTCLQALAAVATLGTRWHIRRIMQVTLTVIIVTLLAEALGTATGFPFGRYHYTNVLQPQILNVPVVITIAWLMMLPSSWAVGQLLTGKTSGWRFILVSAAAMTAWDFFLDPQMVNWGLWEWQNPGSINYFGIPWINYAGWVLTSAVVTVLAQPDDLPIAPLLSIYVIVWVLQTIGMLFFWGLVGPAIIGSVIMGIPALEATRRLVRRKQ